ncbi:MAG: hypothetical protein ACI3XA_06795 [Clostridia bacterium]
MKREKLIKIIRHSLAGVVAVHLIDIVAPRVADGILNRGEDIFKEGAE